MSETEVVNIAGSAEGFAMFVVDILAHYQEVLKSVETEKQDVFDTLVAMNKELCALREEYLKENNNV